MEQNIIAVSQVNEYIKFLLDRDELLTNLCVRGEDIRIGEFIEAEIEKTSLRCLFAVKK